MNKILIKLYVPTIEEQFEIWIPINRRIYTVIELLIKAIKELSSGYYEPMEYTLLYDKDTGVAFDINDTVKDANIRNGDELILI